VVEVFITTDQYPEQTTWDLTTPSGLYLIGYRLPTDVAENPLEPYTRYQWQVCFIGSGYTFFFNIYDAGFDGLEEPGEFNVTLDGTTVASGSSFFGSKLSTQIVASQSGGRKLRRPKSGMRAYLLNADPKILVHLEMSSK
jgi:hypothetical protein